MAEPRGEKISLADLQAIAIRDAVSYCVQKNDLSDGEFVMLLVALAIFLSSSSTYGAKLNCNGGELYYTNKVSKLEATKLGEFLVKEEFFDGQKKSVQLNKKGDTYEVRLVIKEDFREKKDYLELLKVFAAQIRDRVFDGEDVVIHICDEKLKTLKEVEPLAKKEKK